MRIALQKRLNIDATIHGMRSSFKDWASEKTNFNNEVSEMALAHSIGIKLKLLTEEGICYKKKALMNEWEHFLYKRIQNIYNQDKRRPNQFLSNI